MVDIVVAKVCHNLALLWSDQMTWLAFLTPAVPLNITKIIG